MEPNLQNTPVQQIPPTTPDKHVNLLPMIIVGIVMLILGLGGGYLLFVNKGQVKQLVTQTSPTTTQGVNPTSNLSPTIMPTSTINVNSITVEQDGIKMTINPTQGPPGTKVRISITGIVENPNVPYATIGLIAKNGVGADSQATTYTFNTTKISQSGAYETIYTIPSTVLILANPGDQNPSKEVPIEVGVGNIFFSYNHPTFHDISIKAPFTVTSD